MACYRLSFLTIDGQWRGARDFECANDAEGCRIAESLSEGWGMQLWRGDTLVRSFPVFSEDTAEPGASLSVADPSVTQDLHPDLRGRRAA
jgi:hypothetical protein